MQEIEGIHDSDLAESRWGFLVPWTALLVGHEIRVKTKCNCDDTYRFTFDAIYLNMQRNVMFDHASHRALQTMAEAIQLIATALALYPDAWTALLVDQCDCGIHFDHPIHDTSEFAPRFEFDCSFYPGDILMAKTGLRFFQVLLDSTARTPQFYTAMHRLLLLPGAATSHRTLPPVPFRIDLSLWNEDQDILVGFMDFVRALKPFAEPNPTDGRRPWSIVESIEIDWTGPGVCTDLVERTFTMVSHAPFVQITTATIDPKYVTCSSAELRQLLATLAATYPRLKLRLGDVAPGTTSGSILDESSAESDPKVALVMDSVASTQAQLSYLNIGHLMTAAGPLDRSRRQSVWNHLFGTLLGQKSACEIKTLALNSPRVMNVESDAHAIHLAATSFPSFKMPARLTLGLTHADQASIRAVISAFGASLQELRLYDRHQVIPSTTIAFILQMCPKLEYLDVDNAALDSMSLFYGAQVHCRLKRLVLNNVILRDAASMFVFLTQLADPESCLGGSLSEFVLARYGHAATRQNTVVIGATHVTLVEKILRFNGRVHTLQLDVDETAPTEFIDACTAVHGTAAAVRLTPLSLPRKVAFLSVLDTKQNYPWANVSADVVGKIFEFAAECKPRWVQVKKTQHM